MADNDEDVFVGQRVFGCECIQQMGQLLKLPQVAVSTAQVMFHRFYAKRSLKKFDVRVRHAPFCLLLTLLHSESPMRSGA
jgi:hypothetical protein|tara:strand:- start:88 stop:327 length:240 start_codon:yes stop_codon:yes gene_type:complete